MASLFASLNASSQSLAAFERAINISQNNVANFSTPGYAAQVADFTALSFDAQSGLAGGVSSSSTTTRSDYLDASVRTQLTNLGNAQQQTQSLGGIVSLFDVSGATGVPAAFTKLFSSFSDLSVSPSSAISRQSVLSAAADVASAFKQVSAALSKASSDADGQITSQLNQVSALASKIRDYNTQRSQSGTSDAGRDANLSATLESLSSLVNISTRTNPNGGTDVLIDGQIPLVLGSQQFSFSTAPEPAPSNPPLNPNGTPRIGVIDSEGRDVTSHFSGGTLAGVLQFRNTTLGGLLGDRNQNGDVNTLAKSFADRVNTLLTSGVISEGPPVQAGVPLFTYDTTDSTKTAGSLAITAGFNASQIATINPGPPAVSNGTALSLANLVHGSSPQDQVNGSRYSGFFGNIAGAAGSLLASQKNSADLSQQASTQAQSLRGQLSGVNLNNEAVRLTEYQKAYSASAKLIAVLDQIVQSTLAGC